MAEVRLMKSAGGWSDEEAEDLLTRGKARDPDEFRAIFNRYGKPVLSFIYSLLGDRTWAEELLQETFVRAFVRLDSKRKETQMSTWLFGIARNVVREAIKSKYRGPAQIEPGGRKQRDIVDSGSRPDEAAIAGELHRAIGNALRSLSEDYRLVFVLKVFNKMPYEEIARVTGSSVGKLKTDLLRARLQMRRKLKGHLPEALGELRGRP